MFSLLFSVEFQMNITKEMAFSLSFLSSNKEVWRGFELLIAPRHLPWFTVKILTHTQES